MRSDVGRFGIVPAWVIAALRGNSSALAVFCVLASHADRSRDDAWVIGRAQIADEAGVSLATAKRAIVALREIGAVEVEAQVTAAGDQGHNRYLLRFAEPGSVQERTGVGSPVNRGRVSDEPLTQTQSQTQSQTPLTPRDNGDGAASGAGDGGLSIEALARSASELNYMQAVADGLEVRSPESFIAAKAKKLVAESGDRLRWAVELNCRHQATDGRPVPVGALAGYVLGGDARTLAGFIANVERVA